MTPGPDARRGETWFAALPAPARARQGQPAGLVSRTLAAVVDCVVLGLALGGLYLGWAAVDYSLDPVRFTFPTPTRIVTVAVATGVAVLYLAACWAATGRSFGDQLLALRVVDHRGRPPGPVKALVRAVGCVFVPVGLLGVLAGGRRRSLQDLLLRTAVVYDWSTSPGTSDADPRAAGAS